jgi:SNW domain-containing protein 1
MTKGVADSSRLGVVDYLDDENDNDKSVESVTQGQRSSIDKNSINEEEYAHEQRDRLHVERRWDREKEYHLECAGMANPDDDAVDDKLKKKQRLENDRDVSEKVALGTHTGGAGGASGIDLNLYSQSSGLTSGFGANYEYNAYFRPMFVWEGVRVTSSSIYQPTMDALQRQTWHYCSRRAFSHSCSRSTLRLIVELWTTAQCQDRATSSLQPRPSI